MPGVAVQQNNYGVKDGQDEGRDVRVETRDGQTYEGIFAGCSKQFEVGLRYAHEVIPGEDTLLPRRDRVIDKLQFDPADVISVSVVIDDEDHHKGFAMDKDIGARNGEIEAGRERELEEWVPDGDEDDLHLEGRGTSNRAGGWSVEEMFNVNKELGVESTFQDDLRQYTTVHVEGDEDAYAKAAAIAREIEMNPASKHMARLENDDDERDLNKETSYSSGKAASNLSSPPAGAAANYSGPSRQNSTGSQQGHRMTFSSRGGSASSRSIGGPGGAGADRRGGGAGGRGVGGRGGQVGSSYSTQRSGGYSGAQNAQGPVTGGPRSQGPSTQQQRGYQHDRSTGQSQQQSSHNDFGNWADMRTQNYQEQQRQQLQQTTAAAAAATQPPSSQVTSQMTAQPPSSSLPATTPQQPPRGQRRSDGGQSTGKQPPSQYDSSTFPRNVRGGGVVHQGKLEGVQQGPPGGSLSGGATSGPPPSDNGKQRRTGSNITELKQWQEKFSSSFRPEGPPPQSQRVNNAWQQGPPRFRAPIVQPQPGAQGEATAAIAAGQEPTATLIHDASQQPQGQRSPSVGAHVQHMQQQQRQTPQVPRADSVRSPPRGVQAPPQHLDQTPESNSQRERQQSTTSSSGKRFEFNPDAPVFTPRSTTSGMGGATTQQAQIPQQPPPAASAPPAQSPAPMQQVYYNGGQYPTMVPSSVAPGVYGAVPAGVQVSMAQLPGGGTVYSMPYTVAQPPQPIMTLQQPGGQRPRRPQQNTTATMFVGQPMQYPQTVVSTGPSPYGQVIHYAAVPPNMQQPTAIYPSGVATPHFMPAGRMLAPQSGAAPYFIQQTPQQMDPTQHQAHLSFTGGVVAAQPMGGLPPQQPPTVPPPGGSNGANHSQPPTPGPPPAPSPAQHQQPSVTPQSPHGMSAPPPQQQMYAATGIVPPAVSGGNGSVMVLGQPSGYQLLYPQQGLAAAVQQQFTQGQYLIGAQGPPPQFAQTHGGQQQQQQFVSAQEMQQHPYQYAIHAQQGAHGQMIPQTFVRQNSMPSAPIAPHFIAAHMPPPPQQQQPQTVMQPPQNNG